MRQVALEHRPTFLKGAIIGLLLVFIKLIIVLPVDVANMLYGICLLFTLVITFADLVEWEAIVLHPRVFDFVVGFLSSLDSYAVLILFGLPLPN